MTLELPTTRLVNEAKGVAERAMSSALVAHSVRCFLLGRAYAKAKAIELDEEGLCLAALFHDVGLSPEYRNSDLSFQLHSSRALREFLRAREVPEERIGPLVDAIDFHMQVFPRWSKGNVAGVLQVAAWMDITRLRRHAIKSEAEAIERAHPKGSVAGEFRQRLVGSIVGVKSCVGLIAPGRYR